MWVIIILSFITVYVAFEMYRLRIKVKCLSIGKDIDMMEHIVNDLPKEIEDSVNKKIKSSETRIMNNLNHHTLQTKNRTDASICRDAPIRDNSQLLQHSL